MDHRAVLARLPRALRATLTQRSDRLGLLHLAGHVGLIGLTGTAIALRVPFWPLLLLPHGVFLTFLFTLEHEATHETPFATRWLNTWVGRLCGVILILPFTWFRYFHLAHHRYTNDPDRDPELQAGGKPETWRAFFVYVSGWLYWRGMITQLVKTALGRADAAYVPARRRSDVATEARWMLLIYGLFGISLVASPLVIWLWVVPMLLGQPVLRVYLLAEHSRCAAVSDMFANTRTTLTSRLVRFLAWNMPYHAEHHAWPQVPFHQLPRLHNAVADHLKETAPSYRAFTGEFVRDLT